MLTFLLTDIADSTPLWESQPDAMEVALARHDEVVADIVEANGGRLIKFRGEGDATVSVFTRPPTRRRGVGAPAGLRAEPWPNGIELACAWRCTTGEAQLRGGDYFGTALSRAARLRGLAAAATSSCPRPVPRSSRPSTRRGRAHDPRPPDPEGLARRREPFALTHPDLPEPKPLATVEVGLEPHGEPDYGSSRYLGAELRVPLWGPWAVRAASLRVPLPARLRVAMPDDFVGRTVERERLAVMFKEAAEGRRRVALVAGDPGIGKSSLVAASAADAFDSGATVLHGGCVPAGAPYQPFLDALGHYVAHTPRLDQPLGRGTWPSWRGCSPRCRAGVGAAPAGRERSRHRALPVHERSDGSAGRGRD